MGYAFISYSSKNQSSADAMRELFNKNAIDTWMAPYDIPSGSEYAEVLYDALIGCSCLVLMLTNNAQNSQWVKNEVEIALTNGKAFIPIQLEDIELNSSMKWFLTNKQITAVHKIDENAYEIRKVLDAVKAYTADCSQTDPTPSDNHEVSNASSTPVDTYSKDTVIEKPVDNIENVNSEDISSQNHSVDQENRNEDNNIKTLNLDNGSETNPNTEPAEESDSTKNTDEEKPKELCKIDNKPFATFCSDISKIDSFNLDSYDRLVKFELTDGSYIEFELCDVYEVSPQKKYWIARQTGSSMYLFFIIRIKNGKMSIISEGKDQKRLYAKFRAEHKDEYYFTDKKTIVKSQKKLKLFTPEAVQHLFHSSNDIPQILTIPNKYYRIPSNAFERLHPDGKEIKQIIISENVEEISENAFSGLIVTQTIFIPDTVTQIAKNAFTLKDGAFVYCDESSRAYSYCKRNNIPVVTDIPFDSHDKNDLFKPTNTYCTRITPLTLIWEECDEILIPSGIIILDQDAFLLTKIKKRIVIPDSVIKIDRKAFVLSDNAYVECTENSYAYLYCRENELRNSVDINRSKGLCVDCGGTFTGLFKKKCRLCGKPKNY